MSKPTFSMDDKRSSDLVAQAFPDDSNPGSSPNEPVAKAAREAAAVAEVLALRHEQERRRDDVASGKKD